MSHDRWDGFLSTQPLLDGLARRAALRRHAHERSVEEDVFEVDEAEEHEPVRLAAADGDRFYRDGVYVVEVARGVATQTAGPAGLTLVIGELRLVLVPGVPSPVPPLGEVIVGVDAVGGGVRLVR